MTTNVASDWTVFGDEFSHPGAAVADRSGADLGDLVAMLHRLKAQGRVLAYGNFGYDTSSTQYVARASNEAGQTTYRTTARGNFWWRGGRIRARLHFYGTNCLMQAQIDGGALTVSAAAGGTLGIASSSITNGTIAPGVDGEVDFTIEVRQDGSSGSRVWYGFVLEAVEEDTEFGDYDDYDGAFQQIDSSSTEPDSPMVGWLLATIERNIRDLQRSKPRGACHTYPEANATNTTDAVLHDRCLVGSIKTKCQGPYVVWAPPWATELDVFLECASAVTGLTSTVSVVTDQDGVNRADEIRDTAAGRAQTLLNTSPTTLKWAVPIAAQRGSWTPVRVWIVHEGEIGSSTDSYQVQRIDPVGMLAMHLTTWEPGLPHDGPFGLCLGMPEPVADGTVKSGLYVGSVESFVDFAAGLATGESVTPRYARITASPSVRRLKLLGVLGEDYQASEPLSQYSMALLRIYSVYAGARSGEGAISAKETRAAAQVDRIPRGTRFGQTIASVNELVLFSAPQLAIRCPGQRWLRGEELGATNPKRVAASAWTFIDGLGGTSWQEVATWIVPSALVAGGDVDVAYLESTFFVVAIAKDTRGNESRVSVEARLSIDGTPGDTHTLSLPMFWSNDEDGPLGRWDAAQAAKTWGLDEAGSDPIYEYAYTQQCEWFSERISNADWYTQSPAIRVAAPTTLPATCRLEVRAPTAGLENPTLVIVGAGLHAGRRQ